MDFSFTQNILYSHAILALKCVSLIAYISLFLAFPKTRDTPKLISLMRDAFSISDVLSEMAPLKGHEISIC